MRLTYYVANAFTQKPFCGNPAAVFLLDDALDTDLMQRIARQLNLVETIFIKEEGEDAFYFRYFTPHEELPIAGHPTIAGLRVLHELVKLHSQEIAIRVKHKTIMGHVDASQGEPILSVVFDGVVHGEAYNDRARVAKVLGIGVEDIMTDMPIKPSDSGLGHLIVPIASLEALMRVKRDIEPLYALCDSLGCMEIQAFTFETIHDEHDIHTRNICPREGLEDPACGSGNAALMAYLSTAGADKHEYRVEQGYINHFESIIHGKIIDDTTVMIGGHAIIMGEGKLYV